MKAFLPQIPQGSRILLLAVLALFLAVSHSSAAETSAKSQVEWAYFRKVSEFDPGSIHMCIRNEGTHPLPLRSIRVQGKDHALGGELTPEDKKALTRWEGRIQPEHEPGSVLWCSALPRNVRPGQHSEIIVKFAAPPLKTVHISLNATSGQAIAAAVEPKPPPLMISRVSFAQDLASVYVYLTNIGTTPARFHGLLMDGELQPDEAVDVLPALLPPGQKQVIKLRPDRSLSLSPMSRPLFA